MLIEGDTLRLTHGPKENHARPGDRSAVPQRRPGWGPRVIGVILTGQMDDGTAGLKAIKDCGGIAIVQDPATPTNPRCRAARWPT
jgi:two-component system chemotaxis response regulator CheB